jgi:hypothetical protein
VVYLLAGVFEDHPDRRVDPFKVLRPVSPQAWPWCYRPSPWFCRLLIRGLEKMPIVAPFLPRRNRKERM